MYIIRRLGTYAITLWSALTINFILPRLMPGDPASVIMARARGQISSEARDALVKALGLGEKNIFLSYIGYVTQVFQGNFGVSLSYFPSSVWELIKYALPWTIFLFGLALIISFIVGTLLGIIVAWRRGSATDSTATSVSLFVRSLPPFWIAMGIVYILGLKYGIIPISHAHDTRLEMGFSFTFIRSVAHHAIGPFLPLFFVNVGNWLFMMRNNMISVLGEDFITMAKAEGLKDWMVMFRYAARNALLPNITALTMSMGFMFAGALLVEIVFSYPGIGYLLYQAVTSLDYPLMQACFFFSTVIMITLNFLVEFVYVKLDPRIAEKKV